MEWGGRGRSSCWGRVGRVRCTWAGLVEAHKCLVGLAGRVEHVVAAVRDLTHAESAGEAVRALAEALAAVAPDFLAESVDLTVWAKRYGPRACDWNWPRAKAERDGLAEQFGRDGPRDSESTSRILR